MIFTQTIHTLVMPQGPTYTLQMDFEYDSWNRIKQMTYPDGEGKDCRLAIADF